MNMQFKNRGEFTVPVNVVFSCDNCNTEQKATVEFNVDDILNHEIWGCYIDCEKCGHNNKVIKL